jgi:hypothetical protein
VREREARERDHLINDDQVQEPKEAASAKGGGCLRCWDARKLSVSPSKAGRLDAQRENPGTLGCSGLAAGLRRLGRWDGLVPGGAPLKKRPPKVDRGVWSSRLQNAQFSSGIAHSERNCAHDPKTSVARPGSGQGRRAICGDRAVNARRSVRRS